MSCHLRARRSSQPPPRGALRPPRGVALLALLLLLLLGPLAAAAPSPLPTGLLAGPVGEEEHGYPWSGRRFGGRVSLGSPVNAQLDGDLFELRQDGLFPTSLHLRSLRSFWGHDGHNLLDLDWDQPTGRDSDFRGRFRDFRNFDLGHRRSRSHWYDPPAEDVSRRGDDRVELRLRKWAGLQLHLAADQGRVDREAEGGDRQARWTSYRGRLDARTGSLDHRIRATLTAFTDLDRPAYGYRDQRYSWRLARDISPDTNLRASFRTRQRQLDGTGEVQRDLSMGLSTRTYDAFRMRGLKWLNQVAYRTRPQSFQRTQDLDESLALRSRLLWNLRRGGVIEAGVEETWREEFRLDRRGVVALLRDPTASRSDLSRFRKEVFPHHQDSWLRLTARLTRKAKLFAGYERQDLGGAPDTAWVAASSPTLLPTSRQVIKAALAMLPWPGVDLRLDHRREERRTAEQGDHRAHQQEGLASWLAHLRLSFLPRTTLELDLGDRDLQHVDEGVRDETIREVTNYRLGLGYDLSERILLEGSYHRLDHDGAQEATQEIVDLALDYGGSGSRAHMRLAYTFDDYADLTGPDSYRARVVSVSGEMTF